MILSKNLCYHILEVIAVPSQKAVFTLRLDSNVHSKIKYIADENFRPLTSEITKLILERIAEYEKEHGTIEIQEGECQEGE